MKSYKKFAIAIIILGAVIAAPFLTGRIIVNTTPSVSIGLWLLSEGEIKRGDAVQVSLNSFEFTDWVPEIYKKRNGWGEILFLKRVAGLPGDEIKKSGDMLILNSSEIIPDSGVLSQDGLGNELKVYNLPVKLKSDEAWLTSDIGRGFDSRYLGPAKLNDCKKVVPLIVK